MTAIGGALAAFLVFGVAVVVYFLPTGIAVARNHRNVVAILLLNLFLGWSVIGWIVALVWAVYKERDNTRSAV